MGDLLEFSNKILEALSKYEEDTSYPDEEQECVKLKTLIGVQGVIRDVLQQSMDEEQGCSL